LNYISSFLCCSGDSLFFAYEPVMPGSNDSNGNSNGNSSSVVEGYAMDYFGQFVSKLDRGTATATTAASDGHKGSINDKQAPSSLSESSFAPIGRSPTHVMNRLRRNGFDGIIDCTPMAKAAKYFKVVSQEGQGQPPELFDEYAAFQLHLHCYSIVCATGSSSRSGGERSMDARECAAICPWVALNLDGATRGIRHRYKKAITVENESDGNSMDGNIPSTLTLTLAAIKLEDQEQVRDIFKETYSHMFEVYLSVKKMVKSALKADLSMKGSGVSLQVDGEGGDKVYQTDCAIWNNYSNGGGAFWVVTVADNDFDNNNSNSSSSNTKVVGCIGVKKCACSPVSISNVSTFYEIHRLSVQPSYRGKGIGKLLLQSIEDFVRYKELDGTIGIIATTPKVMEAANALYASNAFDVQEETLMGKMVIRTFVKVLQNKP